MSPRLTRSFYRQAPVALAKSLLGHRLVRIYRGRRLAGIIVETEAYLGILDRAAHTFNARHTARNHSMYLDGGHAYVYFTYGLHYCLNVVAARENDPVAVLIRAIEPTEGLQTMCRLRSPGSKNSPALRSPATGGRRLAENVRWLCSGPAKLCQALAINRSLDGADLVTSDALFIEKPSPSFRGHSESQIAATPRIGVHYAREWAHKPLRFHLKKNPHVSRL